MKFSVLIMSVLLSLASHASSAQNADAPIKDERYQNWYQIEMVVFERVYDNDVEIWPRNVGMAYPRKLKHLFTAEQWSEHIRSGNYSDEDSRHTSAQSKSIHSNFDNTTSTHPEATLPEMETSRILLGSDQFKLKTEAQKLRNRSAYQVLFHEAWREPLTDTESTAAIPIFGGELFGNHYELEGWIKVSLNRFLHFESDLWKVGYELNYGQEIEYWPPAPAFPSPGAITEDEELTGEETLGFSQFMPQEKPMFEIDQTSIPGGFSLNSYSEIEKSPYVINRVITLKQKRRMRSEELHYIDHPKLGILLTVTPYEVFLPKAEPVEQLETAQENEVLSD